MRAVLVTWLFGACSWALVCAPFARAGEDDLDVIVHSGTPVTALGAVELEALFTRTQTRWPDGSSVVPLSFPSGSNTRTQFDRAVLRLGPDQVARFWLDRRIRGLGAPPKQVTSATLMLSVVRNLPGSIGYLPALRSRAGVKVVARIVNGKVSPP